MRDAVTAARRPRPPVDLYFMSGDNVPVSCCSGMNGVELQLPHPVNCCSCPARYIHRLGDPAAGFKVKRLYSAGIDRELLGPDAAWVTSACNARDLIKTA